MEWINKSISINYFKELEDVNYIPDFSEIEKILKINEYGIVRDMLGCGDSGCAYLLSSGYVLKITTNKSEADVAKWIIDNPHPTIAKYFKVWEHKKLHCIIMEKLTEMLKNTYPIDEMINICEKSSSFDPNSSFWILSKDQYNDITYISQVRDYLSHIKKYGKSFDFLNTGNIAISNGKLKFFDIT